ASAVLGDKGTDAARSDSGPRPTVVEYAADFQEADGVARAIAIAARSGREWSGCAVLARTNFQLTAIGDACEREGVPVRVGSARPFLESPAVDRILRPIARSHDPVRFREWLAALVKRSDHSSARDESGSPFAFAEESALVEFAEDYTALEPMPTGPGFVAFIREAGDPTGTDGGIPGVDLLTFHRAKGLEWESVWVIGLEDGYVPLVHAVTEVQRAEEQRLLYVAMTRARDTLHLSWARTREMGNRTVARTRSPFLGPAVRAMSALPPQTVDPRGSARIGIEASRAALRRARPV
ncbi:MAG TPA: 3'-5' exonuclease, partial [Acidimicrobiales bacterium]|nr:3'-5' exonuclease [Acidimicrobiales bacterium]